MNMRPDEEEEGHEVDELLSDEERLRQQFDPDYKSPADDDDDDDDGKVRDDDGDGKVRTKDDDDTVSPAIQKRFDQMTYRMRQAERREEAAEQRAKEADSRFDALENATVKTSRESFRAEYDQTKIDLKAAFENGDSDAQVAATEKLADMRARAAMMQRPRGDARDDKGDDGQGRGADMTPEAREWWKRSPWFNSSGYERETSVARNIDLQLTGEGFDQNDHRYFEEMDDRLQKLFPDLYSDSETGGDDEDEEDEKPRRRPRNNAAGGQRRGGRKPRKNRGRNTLTKRDLRIAGELGLTTKEQLDEYAIQVDNSRRRA